MSLRVNLVVLWFALSAVQGAAGSPSKIAITHVTVIDVRAGTIAQDMTVLIVGDRISAVRAATEKERLLTKEIEVIDGRGKYLIPGLWDMHAHSDGDDRALHLLIAYGITGIRDMAGDAAKLADARRRITSRELTGPRLVFSGPMLEGPPSQADDWTWIIHSPEEARNAIDRLVELRVDFIKVHDGLARESYLAIAAASRERGISFAGHVPASMSRNLPSGCDPQSLDELLHRFAHNGTWLDPTIQSFRYWAPTQWSAILSEFRELVPSIRQNHVSILAGTDSSSVLEQKGDPPGTSLHDELALLVGAGFTPSEALRAATWNPALFLGLSDSLGTIEAGKTASMVLLEASPLEDIRNTERIVAVIFEGRYLNREVLERLRRENCRNCSAGSAH